jgi:hypothetical protein
MRIESLRFGSGLGRAQAFEIDFGISFEECPYEDCRTELYDELAMSNTTGAQSFNFRVAGL